MSALELKEVRKHAAQAVIVHGINLSIKTGQLVVIVGPSGCGKTLLLRMIAGLEEVSSGEILINTQLVNHLPPRKRNIAMVFQQDALYPHMTVYDNMAYALKIRKMPRDEINKKVLSVSKKLYLDAFLDHKPAHLSSGQRQRVAMGRAIVREPALFLFDEPLSNLDAKLRVEMRLEIHRLQRELGVTSLYVTHDQVEAMTLADVLVVMNEGRIEQVGKPIEVYQKPATQFVASFMGSPAMNFIEAKVIREGSTLLLDGEKEITLFGHFLESYEGKKVMLGIRPEMINLATDEDQIKLKLRVELVEILGSDTIVYGHLEESRVQLVLKLPGQIRTHPGEVFTVTWRIGDLHFFDPTSGNRVIF